MMGHREKLIDGIEEDFIYARGLYCYLVNNTKLKRYVKRKMSKRYRHEAKRELRSDNNV